MISLSHDVLHFQFPQVHRNAKGQIQFVRTLRIPDDDETYPLPPGLGWFPLRHVDDFAERVPAPWRTHGGVMLPMYQAEAMWLSFDTSNYPFALKIAAGKIDAVTGEQWQNGIHADPQDYVVLPEQPWLDGFCVEKGVIRQFVAMPLGSVYSAEEQITGKAEHGGLQIAIVPMKREVYEKVRNEGSRTTGGDADHTLACMSSMPDMGLAPGGRMRQEIYDDPYGIDAWDTSAMRRCFVHLTNSLVWEAVTGSAPPTPPPTAKMYTDAGLPWFDYYSDEKALAGSDKLAALKSIWEMAEQKCDNPLPENESVEVDRVVQSGKKRQGAIREGTF